MISVRQKIREISPWHQPKLPYDRATSADLHYCYRLILKREPDPEGWDNWLERIELFQLNLQTMVDEFLICEEFKKLQREARRTVLLDLDDFKLFIRRNDFYIGAVIEKVGCFEPHVSEQMRENLEPGFVFVDIGANIGYLTLLGATLVGAEGQVHAFEPNSDNCQLIKRSLEANELNNVIIYPNAVAEKNKTIKLIFTGTSSNTTMTDLPPDLADELEPKQIVQAVTIDETLSDLERLDLIKMDIEGAEPRAWVGMEQIIRRHRPRIIFEFSPPLIRVISQVEPKDFLKTVIQSDYDLFIIKDDGGLTDTAQNPEKIVQWYRNTGYTKIDLLALPSK